MTSDPVTPAGPVVEADLGDRESLLRQARIWAKEDQGIEALVTWLDESIADRARLEVALREARDLLMDRRPIAALTVVDAALHPGEDR